MIQLMETEIAVASLSKHFKILGEVITRESPGGKMHVEPGNRDSGKFS